MFRKLLLIFYIILTFISCSKDNSNQITEISTENSDIADQTSDDSSNSSDETTDSSSTNIGDGVPSVFSKIYDE